MANVKFNRKEIEKVIKLTPDVVEKINLMGIPVESLDNDFIEIQVLPNRPDLISPSGFTRAVKAYLGKEPGLKKYDTKKSGETLIVEKTLPKEYPYGIACIVKGLTFDDEKIKDVIDIQEKLGSTLLRKRKKGGIGLYPLDKLHFPIKLKGLKAEEIIFRPLEYPEKISARKILAVHPTGKEYAHLVEKWDKLPVFVDKVGTIMSMPPIINSHDVGKIDKTVKDVFVEATGTDLNTLKKAMNILVTYLADKGGKIYSMECVQQDGSREDIPALSPEKMKISLENVNKTLGLELKEKDIEKLLPRMGFDYKNSTVSIPAYRTDILHEVDIIEDIAIAYGYENLVPEIPQVSTIGEESKRSKIKSKISDIVTGLGLIEISSYNLIKEEEAKITKEEKIELENSKTDYKILRSNLLVPAMRNFKENKDNEYPQKIFEIGKVFSLDKKGQSETGIIEKDNLVVAVSPGNFTDIKQILDYVIKMLGLTYTLKEGKKESLIDGRTGLIIVNDKEIGYIGETEPSALQEWGIKMPVAIFELSLEEIYKLL